MRVASYYDVPLTSPNFKIKFLEFFYIPYDFRYWLELINVLYQKNYISF